MNVMNINKALNARGTPKEKHVLLVLATLARGDGQVETDVSLLAYYTGRSRHSVRKILARLFPEKCAS